jgi:hypothetical protein
LAQTIVSSVRHMGFLIGIEPHINRHFDFHARVGTGILGYQSRQTVDATVIGPNGASPDDVVRDGPTQLVFFNPAYATLDLGIVRRIGHVRFGFSLETFVTFVEGPRFGTGRVQARPGGIPCEEPNKSSANIECIPALTTPAVPSQLPSITLIPQLFFGLSQ